MIRLTLLSIAHRFWFPLKPCCWLFQLGCRSDEKKCLSFGPHFLVLRRVTSQSPSRKLPTRPWREDPLAQLGLTQRPWLHLGAWSPPRCLVFLVRTVRISQNSVLVSLEWSWDVYNLWVRHQAQGLCTDQVNNTKRIPSTWVFTTLSLPYGKAFTVLRSLVST